MEALLARGEGSQEALRTVHTQRMALEQAEAQDDDKETGRHGDKETPQRIPDLCVSIPPSQGATT